MKLSPAQLTVELSSAIDPTFAKQIVDSYVEMQNRFLAGDWKPTELDDGRLCEAISRALLQLDTGKIDHRILPGAVQDILLDTKAKVAHVLDFKDRSHIAKVIETVYKFRSDRGAVHVSPTHTANYMDSMLVLHAGKWMFAEFLRLAWNKDRNVVAAVIEQIVQLEHSMIHELDGKPLVLVRGISAPEEVLLLLFHSPTNRLSRAELRKYAPNQNPKTVGTAITRLIDQKDIRPVGEADVALTPNGQKRVIEDVLPKHAPK